MGNNWYDDITGGPGRDRVSQGYEGVQNGFNMGANLIESRRQEARQKEALLESRSYAERQAAEARAREQTELDRPVAAPVNDLLNSLREKVVQQQMPGALAGKLYKLYQAGQLTQEQVQHVIEEHAGSATPVDGAPSGIPTRDPLGGLTPKQGTPPALTGPEVTTDSPEMRAMAAQSKPYGKLAHDRVGGDPNGTVSPAIRHEYVPPPVNMPEGPVAEPTMTSGVAPQRTAPSVSQGEAVPPPPNAQPQTPPHQWTVREVQQLNAAGGYPRPKEKSESEIMLELIKEQGRGNRNTENNQTKGDIAGGKIEFEQKKLGALVTKWNADRSNLWNIAVAKLESMERKTSGTADAKRDVENMKDAEKALKALKDQDTKMRTSINSLAQDPSVIKAIEENAAKIQEYEQRYLEAKKVVEERVRGTKTPSGTTTTQTKTEPSYKVSEDEWLKLGRGQ